MSSDAEVPISPALLPSDSQVQSSPVAIPIVETTVTALAPPKNASLSTRSFIVLVVRDLLINLAITLTVSFIAGFFYSFQQTQAGKTITDTDHILNQYSAEFLGGVGSVVAYAISGSLGRQSAGLRTLRLCIVAGLFCCGDIALGVIGNITSRNPDFIQHPVGTAIGIIFGCFIGGIFRVGIGRTLSMLIAPPRKPVSPERKTR